MIALLLLTCAAPLPFPKYPTTLKGYPYMGGVPVVPYTLTLQKGGVGTYSRLGKENAPMRWHWVGDSIQVMCDKCGPDHLKKDMGMVK